MTTLTIENPVVTSVEVSNESLSVELEDGRSISVPLGWYPRLQYGSNEERSKWEIIGLGHGIHWSELDEDISIEGLIAGKPSNESQKSLKKWLESRSGV